jgi:proteasome activator subunit 4
MDANRISEMLVVPQHENGGANISRATSPGANWQDVKDASGQSIDEPARCRPRTYPYTKTLPYHVETNNKRQQNLSKIIQHLYLAIETGDFAPGGIHWTKELRSWLGLKFDLPRDTRVKLVKLYYELSLAPGMDSGAADRFSSMFMVLTK